MEKYCYKWEEADFTWDGNDYTWDDVCFALVLLAGHDDPNKWDEQHKQKFITLYAKVKQQTEPELFYSLRPLDQTNKTLLKEVKITAEDVKLVIENVLKITVEI